jgi:hypothetical protein
MRDNDDDYRGAEYEAREGGTSRITRHEYE